MDDDKELKDDEKDNKSDVSDNDNNDDSDSDVLSNNSNIVENKKYDLKSIGIVKTDENVWNCDIFIDKMFKSILQFIQCQKLNNQYIIINIYVIQTISFFELSYFIYLLSFNVIIYLLILMIEIDVNKSQKMH